MKQTEDWYQDGATFAKEVQDALTAGKTFEEIYHEMHAVPPERAAHIRDLYNDPDLKA